MRRGLKFFCTICVLLLSFLAVESDVKGAEGGGLLIMSKPVSDVEIFSGSAKGSGKGTELTFIFSEHVGGSFDAGSFTEGTYFTLDYTGEENGIYIALVSASGGSKWTAVYPSSSESIGDNMWRQTYSYDAITEKWGTNFQRLDTIQIYADVTGEVTMHRMAYVLGDGEQVDTTDGTWDVPMEGIAFIGDSIVQNPLFYYGDWNTVLDRTDCVNYGIGSQTTRELKSRIDDLLKGNYEKIVFLCGINDLGGGRQPFVICAAYRDMLDAIAEKLPEAQVYILSVLPTTDALFTDSQGNIQVLNANLEFMTKEYDFVTFVNVYPEFLGEDGYGKEEYYTDGLHPNEAGYELIANVLNPYLNGEADAEDALTGKAGDENSGSVPYMNTILFALAGVGCLVAILCIALKIVSGKKKEGK